jgi:hypothetical protein
MPWLEEQGKRKWISGKKWKRHQHRGLDTELYARVKEDQHRRWREKHNIKTRGEKIRAQHEEIAEMEKGETNDE